MRAVICGYYGQGNGGDEALLVSLLQMLPAQVTPLVLSGNPAQTSQRYGVASCDRKSIPALWRALRTSDALIWGGGSLMQDATSFANPFYYGGLMWLAQQLGLKTIAWGQGIGPLRQPLSRWLARQVLRNSTAISVRDQASAKLLAQWNLKVTIAPDPVWALESLPVKDLADLPAPRVAVNLRAHPLLTPQRLAVLTQALADFQQATGTCLLLVPFQASQDLAIARSLAAGLPGPQQIVSLEDPRELKGLFRGVEMVIGMRLHSLIMAAAEGCRCSALSYDPKVSQLMAEVPLPGWELAQLPEAADVLSRAWIEEYENGKPLAASQIQSLRDRALMHGAVLRQALSV
jgi:polysaccharide pyruvyl transferase CsaB